MGRLVISLAIGLVVCPAFLMAQAPVAGAPGGAVEVEEEVRFDEEEEVAFGDEGEASPAPPVFPVLEPTAWLLVLPGLLLVALARNIGWSRSVPARKRKVWPSRAPGRRRRAKGENR